MHDGHRTMNTDNDCTATLLSDADVIAAMREIPGYLDISPADFREVFQVAYVHALKRVRDSIRAADIMTRPAHCVGSDLDLIQAATLLAERGFSGAPVTDAAGRVVGVVSEKDFLAGMGVDRPIGFMDIIAHCLNHRGCMAVSLRNRKVSDIMTAPPLTAGVEATLGEISALFVDRHINRLPIVDSEGRPLGIVTRTNLVQSYCLTNQGVQS